MRNAARSVHEQQMEDARQARVARVGFDFGDELEHVARVQLPVKVGFSQRAQGNPCPRREARIRHRLNGEGPHV